MIRLHSRAARLVLLAALLPLTLSARAQEKETPKLLRQPTLSATSVAFVYGGDLWLAPRAGGVARRLTANPSVKRYPHFSPDGKTIAFTGNYDGNSDVYLIPAEGGEPKRLTYHPMADDVMGWTPDGKSVLFRSARTSFSGRFTKLFTVPIAGGQEQELPLPEGTLASYSPDGAKIAYNRIERELNSWKWKRYRGGMQAYISIYDLAKNTYFEVPHTDTTDIFPMWAGNKIYFLSDRTGTANLFSYDTRSKAVAQLTTYRDYDIKWPSLGNDAIVFEQGGVLRTFDLATQKVAPIPIQAQSDLAATRPGLRRVEANLDAAGISPSGSRAVFAARGEIFTVPAKKGDTRDITNSPGAREIDPVWSPDGKNIAYFSDRSGEYEVYVRPQDGTGVETRLTTDGSVYRTGLNWSPDSKSLLYTDAAMRLWMVTLADKKPILIDSSALGPISLGRWSSDSKWIVYAKTQSNTNGALTLYSVAQQKAFTIGDGRFNDHDAVFDLNGKYLYFLSERTFAPTVLAPEINISFQNMTGVYALALQADSPSPLGPESDEEKPKDDAPISDAAKPDAAKPNPPKLDPVKPAPPVPAPAVADAKPAVPAAPKPDASVIKIDLDGLYRRVIGLPISAGNYAKLNAGSGKLFYLSANALHQYDLTARADTTLISGIQDYDLTPTATKMLYSAPGPAFGIVDVAPGGTVGAGALTLKLEMRTDPRQEWKQIYNEVWRLERDFYYDPKMHGLNWRAIGDRYAKLVPGVTHRDDLTYLLSELAGELNTSHAFVSGAETPQVKQVNVALLGADMQADGAYYRFKKIYGGENWDASRRAPLTEPGVSVKEGDYLLAVNGVPLRTDMNFYAAFEGLADNTLTLKINSKPSDVGAREVKVKPVSSETTLRYLDWVETNRRRVEAATGGRVGYVHVPNTATEGITEFGKAFYALGDKDALIVDERYNSGGFIPDFFVEKLGRKLLSVFTPRYGMDGFSPGGAVYGPKVMLVNEWAGSGGDAFPAFFRRAQIGPIIGKRTAGGLVGIIESRSLMDGGSIAVPQFGLWSPQDGKWIAENHGVDPDVEVSNTPDLVRTGHDPQLERAIAMIQEQLKKNPPRKLQHPPFPTDKLAGG